MFGGGGGLNPRKMQQMMEQMGVDFDELDAVEVTMRLEDGTELYFDAPDVNRIVAQGQETYQVVGEPVEREGAAGGSTSGAEEADAAGGEGGETAAAGEVTEADVELVVQRTGASPEDARDALEAADGDLAAAVEALE